LMLYLHSSSILLSCAYSAPSHISTLSLHDALPIFNCCIWCKFFRTNNTYFCSLSFCTFFCPLCHLIIRTSCTIIYNCSFYVCHFPICSFNVIILKLKVYLTFT